MNRSFAENLTCPHCRVTGVLGSANASKIRKSFVLRRRECGNCGKSVFTKATEEVLHPRDFANKLERLEADMEREAAVA